CGVVSARSTTIAVADRRRHPEMAVLLDVHRRAERRDVQRHPRPKADTDATGRIPLLERVAHAAAQLDAGMEARLEARVKRAAAESRAPLIHGEPAAGIVRRAHTGVHRQLDSQAA